MKEFCLLPRKLAEKCLATSASDAERPTLPVASTFNNPTPELENLLRAQVNSAHQDFGMSFINLLKQTPGITWDSRGNLLSPVQGINLLSLISTLANKKGKFPAQNKSLITTLFEIGNIP